jgi:DNA-binding response OmpR family regulator
VKILVAEDEGGIMEIVELVLTTDGHELTKAKDGEECIKKYLEEKGRKQVGNPAFDLVIVDWSMPQRSGVDAIKEILTHDPDQKVLLATAYSKEALSSLGDLAQRIKVIYKPFDIDELSRVVSSFSQK